MTAALAAISRGIVAPGKSYLQLLPLAEALRDLLEARSGFRIAPDRDIGAGQTRLESGLAISPALAAMCLREPFRTLAFIRGLAAAVGEARRPGRPVRVLYAGCGPYALLALPLMTLYSREKLSFTLLDIHQECLDGARRLIDSLGLDHVEEYLCADAARYRIPAHRLPDVIVSETMAVCLRNEPQVSIVRNLLAQAPGARLVPESVRVEACLLDPAREIAGLPAGAGGEAPAPERDRLPLGTVFSLDAESIHSWKCVSGNRLPGGTVDIPAPLEKRYQPYLLTQIAVHGEVGLKDFDCSLTIPRPWPGRPGFRGGERLRFHYALTDCPELGYEPVG